MKYRYLLLAAAALACLVSCRKSEIPAEEPAFKMHIRLWSHYHENDGLSAQLLDALEKYPGFCDEVWFDALYYPGKERDDASIAKMKEMAGKMRGMGIVPSVQFITVGHPDNVVALHPGIHWGTLVGPHGERAGTQSCPRQTAFQEDLVRYFTPYVEAVKPHGIWIDDDLRLTLHGPVEEACFCDDCIRAFNDEYHHAYTRAALVDALDRNEGEGLLRKEWIAFGQESMALEAAALAKAFHSVSPESHMGLQHVSFFRRFLEGYDWNPIFDAYEKETGLTPLSRPGHGYYNDHAPRGMIEKGLDIARQIQRLNPDITEIAPEIEGYMHRASGKSPHGLCVETMYYLSLGATQMSYSIIASGFEPMDWYADNYFKALQAWHGFAKEYVAFNRGSSPGGLDPYLSPNLPYSDWSEKDGDLGWAYTESGKYAYPLAALGVPFCPDARKPAALMLDAPAIRRMSDEELAELSAAHGIIVDGPAWEAIVEKGLSGYLKETSGPEGAARYYVSDAGGRVAVVSFNADISGKERLQLLNAMDWASRGKLPAIIESFAQATLMPRINEDGSLRSVAIMNCTISGQESYTVRMRGVRQAAPCFVWKHNGDRDKTLKGVRDGDDWIVTTPALEGWNFAWIAVE